MNDEKTVTLQCFEIRVVFSDGKGCTAYTEAPDAIGAMLALGTMLSVERIAFDTVARVVLRQCDRSELVAATKTNDDAGRALIDAAINALVDHPDQPILKILREFFDTDSVCPCDPGACLADKVGLPCVAKNALNQVFGKRG